MDIIPYANQSRQSDGPSSVTAELYFLIARLLSQGPCQNASEALQRELEIHGLLPKRIDWLGNEHDQTYAQVCQSFSHVGSNHLLELCRRLGPLVDKEVPTNVRGVHSLLGAGRQSILRRKEDIIRKLHREHYVVRQNKKPRLFAHDIVHPPNNVPLLLGREFTGSFDARSAAPAKLYSRVQLFCRTLGHLSAVYCVLFDRTGQYIFTGADDLLIKIWSVVTGRLLATLRGASAEIADLAVSCDNTLLAAGSCDKIVRVWCLRTTAPIAVLTGHGGTITSINFCPADRGSVRYLASTSSDGSVSFWEYVTELGQTPKFFPRPHKFNEKIRPGQAQMLCASFSPGGMFMATGCADHHVRVYAMFGQEGPERILEQEAHSDRVDSIQWANTGLRFISGSKDGTALIWRYEKQEWRTIRLRMSCRLEGASSATAEELSQKLKVTMVTWSRDDRYLFTAVSDFSIKIWDSSTGNLHKELRGHEGEAFVLEPHPFDPNVLLSAGHDGRLLIWDLAKGEVMKSFLNFIDGQGHGAVFDAKWNPSGSTIAATDSHGHLSIYGIGPSESFKKLPKAIFFHTDYRPLIRDAHHHVLDEQTQLAPHLMPPPFLVDSEGNPYPPNMQRLVPGRENLKDDQLVPTVVVNANGEQEIVVGVEIPPPPGVEVVNNPPAVVSPPQPTPQRTRSNIDQMIAELAQQQERQRNRPRSSTTAAVAAASASVPSTSTAPPNSDHSYTSRTPHTAHNRPLLIASGSGNSPSASVSPEPALGEGADEAHENGDSVNISETEATTSESLPGFSRRVIVKPLTVGQLASVKNERQGCADEEVTLFYQEVQRKSPTLFLNTSVSPGITALLAARSRGVSDDGWSPSRPRRAHPSRPPRNYQRERNVVSSPARSRMPPVSPARRTSAMAPPQSNNQHNYRTRANRTTNGTRERVREGASDGTRERSRRVVRRVVSTDEDEHVDVEVEERRSSRRTSPRDDDTGDEEETRQTRSNARRQQPRNGDALSTSDSDDSESESDLASDLLESDDSDSETRGSSSSSSSEYSDWTAEAGVNLEPPKRTRKKVYRRPRCLSSEEETAAPSTSAQPTNAEADEGEGSQPGPKKRRGPIPKAGSGGLDRIPESFRPSEWLSSVVPRRQPFYPQMGDEVIYFRQGHEQYVEAINQKKLFELHLRSLPWSNQTIREQELVKIIGIKYEIKPPRLCCLKLGLMDPATGVLTGESFTLKYHDVADVLDFLVLRQNYELAIQRNWQPGDRFRSIIDDLWWEGQLETREPFQAQCPDSMFLCYRIRWDNEEVDRLSPWDLEKIDLDRRPTAPGTGVPVIPSEIAMTLYQPRAEDWPPGGDRDSECDRISAGISQVMGLAIAEPFAAPVDLNLYPSYAYVVEYPMDLSTIKARLENRFYRRVTAVQYDVRYVYTNACKFNEPKSDIVRSASIISDLCLEIIRNRDSVDATALYHQLVERYKIRDEGAEENSACAGPSKAAGGTKRNGSAPNTPNTRSRSRRNSQHTDSESEDTSSKTKSRNGTDNGKSKEKRINTRIAKAAALSWKQQCKDLLETLNQSEDAAPFREPVSILDVPDYLQVIDHPMDLQTVREQLQVSNYATPMDFAKDVRLIFENSKNYNTNKKSRIYAMTVRLSCSFEDHIRNILASYKHRKNTDRSSKSPHSHSKGTKSSKKGKSLVPSRSTRANGVEQPRENIKMILSRGNKGQLVAQPSSSSQSVDPGFGAARRRILEEDEPSASSHSTVPNGNLVDVVEDIEAIPGPSGLSNSTSLPAANGLGKRGIKRRIVSDDDYEEEEDEESPEVSLNVPEEEEEESLEPPDLTKSLEDLTKGKALKRRDAAPPVLKAIKEEESSSEDEKPISQRRRMPMTKVSVPVVKEDVRPSSSSSNSSSISKSNSSNSGSLCEDGSSLRRSGRARRKPKRPLDSEPSENEERSPALANSRKNQKRAVRTRNGGKRTVRYREDSDDEAKKRNSRHAGETKGGSSRLTRKIKSEEEDDDDDDHENEDPSVKQQQNGSVKRCSRQSAQEATKRLRTELPTSSEDEEVPPMPAYTTSSRGRLRKIINHAHQDLSYSE